VADFRGATDAREAERRRRELMTGLDPRTPNVARIWAYQLMLAGLGDAGKDAFAADRAAAENFNLLHARLGTPTGPQVAWEDRRFLRRAVRVATEAGVRQFIDIGSGLPTGDNTHQVAGDYTDAALVVYVDNDPVTIVHGEALLARNDRTHMVAADIRDVDALWRHPVMNRIDFTQPVALLLVALLHLVADEDRPYQIVRDLLAPLAPGSMLILAHNTGDRMPEEMAAFAAAFAEHGVNTPMVPRTHEQVLRFFDGTELLEPGLTWPVKWRPEEIDLVRARNEGFDDEGSSWMYAGVGVKTAP
jgi:hypothetical protein